jgi:hypothetical protein
MLIDQGESPAGGAPAKFSMAMGYWEETPCLAVRWNGYEGSGVGNPQKSDVVHSANRVQSTGAAAGPASNAGQGEGRS